MGEIKAVLKSIRFLYELRTNVPDSMCNENNSK
jgi:hypothetical protein